GRLARAGGHLRLPRPLPDRARPRGATRPDAPPLGARPLCFAARVSRNRRGARVPGARDPHRPGHGPRVAGAGRASRRRATGPRALAPGAAAAALVAVAVLKVLPRIDAQLTWRNGP